jgi:rod shape-determining protein MreC
VPALTDILSRRGEYFVLLLVAIVSIALMLFSTGGKMSVARALHDAALTPVQTTLTGVSDVRGLRAENDSLRASLARVRLEMAALGERALAAERLERMLAFRETSRFDLLSARIIGFEADRAGREFKIDRGSVDGIERNLAVVTPDGLVGRVSEVERGSAYVRPINGPQCSVSARVQDTRVEGILDWTPDHGLHLAFLPLRIEIEVGDEIVSSGLGGVFPRGVPLGRVVELEVDEADGTLRAKVDASVDFGSLEEVFVVTGQHAEFDFVPEPAVDPNAVVEETGA